MDNVYQFQKDGIIEYAGDAGQDKTVTKIISLLDEYQRDVILRTQRSKKMQALIDGKGAPPHPTGSRISVVNAPSSLLRHP